MEAHTSAASAFKYCRCVVLEISFKRWNETEEPLRTVVVAISLPGMADGDEGRP
jgi:hypothetical protein